MDLWTRLGTPVARKTTSFPTFSSAVPGAAVSCSCSATENAFCIHFTASWAFISTAVLHPRESPPNTDLPISKNFAASNSRLVSKVSQDECCNEAE